MLAPFRVDRGWRAREASPSAAVWKSADGRVQLRALRRPSDGARCCYLSSNSLYQARALPKFGRDKDQVFTEFTSSPLDRVLVTRRVGLDGLVRAASNADQETAVAHVLTLLRAFDAFSIECLDRHTTLPRIASEMRRFA